MVYVPDNYDQWKRHDAEEARRLARLPECADCGEPVQDGYYYQINDEVICPSCMEAYRKEVEDYIE